MINLSKFKEIAGQAGQQNNCRIYDIYKHRDRLQILIDKKAPNDSARSAVNLQDCENVFHSLQFLLHSELPHFLENYRLEVSSPGVEKQLREKWHFEESVGQVLKLVSFSPIEAHNKKTGAHFRSQSFTARLTSISKDNLHLKQDFVEWSVPFSKIKSAKLIFQNPKNKKPKKTTRKKQNTKGKNKKSEVKNVS